MANIAAHLYKNAREHAAKTALIFAGREFTFAQLWERTSHLAAGLANMGFRAGDKLALMVATGPEFIVFEHAAFALGGVVVPLNVHYRSNEIEHALGACDVEYLVIQDEFAQRISEELLRRLPHLRRIVVLGETSAIRPTSRMTGAAPLLSEPSALPRVVERARDDLGLMLHTSATTGKAKGVMLSIGNLQANYDCTPDWLGLSHEDRILCALPLYNTFGLNQCINAVMVKAATMVLLPKFDALDVLEAIQSYRCTFFPAVPTMLQKVLNDPRAAQFDITSVRRLLVGAAPVPGPLLEQVYRSMGKDTVVMTGYGLTEATALVSLEHTSLDEHGNLRRPKSVGRPLPGMQMRICNEEGGELPPTEVGQICIKGPNIMQGYYKMPDETASAVVNGWLLSGDLGCTDAEGNFYIVDRKKDLIIRGGQNIYPADIEEQLYAHPAVAEAAVIGRPDEIFGEVPEAFVAFKPGATATVEELMALCQAGLAYFKVPKSIHVLDELPKGPTGKILRRGLRASSAG
ncbi:MAG: long-chain fatty acid--CoA ligase [Gammaproteobacteria bacterium]|nr:long-chain fatty acid--CoA ligase [Gammaproteobacteria bacterium]